MRAWRAASAAAAGACRYGGQPRCAGSRRRPMAATTAPRTHPPLPPARPTPTAACLQWAHRGCIQRWIDEKHDRVCEVCGQPFRGAFRDPPPRPPPAAPLVASLHVDLSDQRTVLLADPVTGEVVARVVMPAGAAEDLSDDEMLQQWRRQMGGGGAGGEASDDEEEEEERGSCGPAGSMACMALLIIFLMGGFAWMSSAAAAGDGEPCGRVHAPVWRARLDPTDWTGSGQGSCLAGPFGTVSASPRLPKPD